MTQTPSYNLHPGRKLAGKYVVGQRLGAGWEGEVYHVTEISSGIERAAKVFYPGRNERNAAIKSYATKLNRLRHCPILIQYHTQDAFRYKGETVPFLVSEYVEGELLSDLILRQRGKRLHPFEALHLLNALVDGISEIHRAGEYHGDLHTDNVIVTRSGLGFRLKLVDLFHWGRPTKLQIREDVAQLVRIFYDALGGKTHYAAQPDWAKSICCGLKRSLIFSKFQSATALGEFLKELERR